METVLLERFTPVAEVNPKLAEKRFVLVVFVPVAFIQTRFVTLSELNTEGLNTDKFVNVALVPINVFTERLVMEELVETKLATVPVDAVNVLNPASPVTARFVVVTLVDVTFPRLAFQRFVALPRLNARSVVGTRFDETVPETISVEVTVRSETLAPPNKLSVVVVNEPRLVTDCSVSTSTAEVAGQPTPFCKQTD